MVYSWTSKDKRQFAHIKERASEDGMPARQAASMAARTVNKKRRLEGKTANVSSLGTGNPNTLLHERTRRELYNRAKILNIPLRSKMNKAELIEEIRARY